MKSETSTNTSSLYTAIIFLSIFFISTSAPLDTDMWWHLRSGDEMWHQGRILLEDIFSYTRAGAPWVNAFWISDLGIYGLWKLGGFYAITLVVALIGVILMSIIYIHMDGGSYLRGLLLLLATIGIHPNWAARPQLISFLLLAYLDYFLDRHRYVKRQPLWVLVLIFGIWGNLHGGFIWGILLLLATIVGEALNNLLDNQPTLSWREIGHLSLWSTVAGLAISLNPNGISLWKLPFDQVNVSLSITEWLSPDFHQFYPHPLVWLLFLLIISFAYSAKRVSFTDLFKGLGFTYLFFVAQRNMGPFAIILLPIISRYLVPAIQSFSNAAMIENIKSAITQSSSHTPTSLRFNFMINTSMAGLLLALALFNAYFVSHATYMEGKLPSHSVQWIKENHPRGRIFNSYNWGGYLTWEVREYPVFIDGRADLYGNEIIQEWLEISNGTKKGLALLEDYQINLIYLEPYQPLLEKLDPNEWEKVYADPQIVIYQRKH